MQHLGFRALGSAFSLLKACEVAACCEAGRGACQDEPNPIATLENHTNGLGL